MVCSEQSHPKKNFHVLNQLLHLQLGDCPVVVHVKDSEDLLQKNYFYSCYSIKETSIVNTKTNSKTNFLTYNQ